MLEAVDTSEARSGDTLARSMSAAHDLDPRDRALATELVYGTLRQQRRLDWALAPRVRQGLDRVEPLARALLRLGAYQVRFLERIPPPIAVSATQDAARELGADRLTGLLNGVLRRVANEPEDLPPGDDDAAIGVRASLPDWIVAELRAAFGDEAVLREAMALRERAPTTVRPTLARGGAEAATSGLAAAGFEAEPGPAGTLVVRGPGDPFSTDAFRTGLFTPQDPASLAVLDLLGPVDGAHVLDLCAGRGVKSTALADRGARVTAVDVTPGKLAEAQRLAERLGLADRVATVVGDATTGLDLPPSDLVLVDAPCSGLGTLRRHPEIAWRRHPDDVTRMAELQARLVQAGAALTRPGGLLVYAVCTFTRIEGEPPVPSGFEPAGPPLRVAPSSGMDAFQARAWRRTSA